MIVPRTWTHIDHARAIGEIEERCRSHFKIPDFAFSDDERGLLTGIRLHSMRLTPPKRQDWERVKSVAEAARNFSQALEDLLAAPYGLAEQVALKDGTTVLRSMPQADVIQVLLDDYGNNHELLREEVKRLASRAESIATAAREVISESAPLGNGESQKNPAHSAFLDHARAIWLRLRDRYSFSSDFSKATDGVVRGQFVEFVHLLENAIHPLNRIGDLRLIGNRVFAQFKSSRGGHLAKPQTGPTITKKATSATSGSSNDRGVNDEHTGSKREKKRHRA